MKIGKIMIVDDDEDILLVTGLAASRIGNWSVVTAASGEEAWARSMKPTRFHWAEGLP